MALSDYKDGLKGKEPGFLKEILDEEGYRDQRRGYEDYLKNLDLERRITSRSYESSYRESHYRDYSNQETTQQTQFGGVSLVTFFGVLVSFLFLLLSINFEPGMSKLFLFLFIFSILAAIPSLICSLFPQAKLLIFSWLYILFNLITGLWVR